MTRINVVSPSELHNKHLLGELHEITRVFGLVRKAQDRKINKYYSLCNEALTRGYKVNPIKKQSLIEGINSWCDYYPNPDNTVAVFLSEDSAYKWIEAERGSRLTVNYEVFEKEVIDSDN